MSETHPQPRCVIVVDEELPAGLAANAAAVLALTLGATMPELVGDALVDADGEQHAGLIPQGLPILVAPRDALPALRRQARAADLGTIDFPVAGQQTTDYEELRQHVASVATPELADLAILFYGPRRTVTRLTSTLRLRR